MPHAMHPDSAMWPLSLSLTMGVAFTAWVYLRGWRRLQSTPTDGIQTWRAISFLLGLSLIWVAAASPIASRDAELLTIHMVQHLLLMTFAAPLIVFGAPVRAFFLGLPSWPSSLMSAFVQPALRRLVRRIGTTLGRPAVCWCAATATLVGWHIPAAFTLAMHSHLWHAVELASFLVSGLLFWWPVARSWRNASTPSGWSIVLYLFLATLPCDILSAFLVFSERVAYPVYLSMPRHSNLSVLDDQQLAGALMWTTVTIVYLVAGAVLSTRLLSPRTGVTLDTSLLSPPQKGAPATFDPSPFAGNVSLDGDATGTEVI
jgi:putative membrane protein